ncbi:LamG-like jellyroll fold domain-containing protein [Phaeodactylibacter luteus]|uniref:T9SS type A sorting domain-containing protein n=1 Tax=Phaeodactylibacter luteus TaxID=1564516 RepID=A0A5C6RLG0_9BACT|nr:LamG-like jellyroll fold domain-containing protein [Phaeodactylibacter luteus]TXB63176.1 T9SS type A sorting domain-containing protein [Phaeodactylibacter luteus]
MKEQIRRAVYLVILCLPFGLNGQVDTVCYPEPASTVAAVEAYFTYGSKANAVSNTSRLDITVGQSLTEQFFSGDILMSTGFWGRFLAPPLKPTVVATKGEYPDRIDITWNLGPFSPRATDGWIIRRNGSVIANLDRSAKKFIDFNAQAGEVYVYEVIGLNVFGDGSAGSDVGFVNPNGVVAGKVETNSQNPVREVAVTLTPTVGYALRFDGVDDYLCMDYKEALPDTAFTFTAWVKIAEDAPQRAGIIDLGSDLSQNWWVHAVSTPQGKGIVAGVGDGTPHELTYIFEHNPEGWHQVSFAYASGLCLLYVDGVFVQAMQASMQPAPARYRIGSFRNEGGNFKGLIDDVRIFDRLLSQREQLLYEGITVSRNTPGLVAYWKFDEGMGEKVFDITDNDFDTLLEGPAFDADDAGVRNGAITDEAGIYVIESINYSAAQTFQARPNKSFYENYALEFNPVFQSKVKLPAFDLPDSSLTVELLLKPFSGSFRQTLLAHESGNFEWYIEDGSYYLSTGGAPIQLGAVDTGYQLLALRIDRLGQSVSSYIGSTEVAAAQGLAWSSDYSNGHWYVGSGPDGEHTLLGLVDELAIFDTLLPMADLLEHVDVNVGIDPGDARLANYFAFNEGSGTEARDAGEMMTGFGQLSGVEFTPQAYRQKATPHAFSPGVRVVSLNSSNTAVGEVDFTDQSSVPIAGVVRYIDTDCYAPNTEIFVNGAAALPPIKTDADGRFVADFEPGSTIRLQPVRGEQTFLPVIFEAPSLQTPIAGVLFQNQTKRTVVGQVAGGLCRKSIIPSPNEGVVQVKARTLNGCYEKTLNVPANGKFAFTDLPPDSVSIAVVTHPDPDVQSFMSELGGVVLDMRFTERDTVDFIYRSRPELEFSDLPTNSRGDFMLQMKQPNQLDIRVYEPYYDGVCYLDTAELVITNDLADYTEDIDTLMTEGILRHRFRAGWPRTVGDYKKPIVVKARRDSADTYVDGQIRAVVLGKVPLSTPFATTSPAIPFLVLHDPPGDGSFAYVESGQTTCNQMSFTIGGGGEAVNSRQVSLGPDISVDVGPPVAQISIPIETTLDFGYSVSLGFDAYLSNEMEVCVTTTETISTSDEDLIVGSSMGGDVFVGAAVNILYGKSLELSYNDTTEQYVISEGILVQPDGFETTFIYTERQIRDIVIPALILINDTESVDAWNRILAYNEQNRANAPFRENISFASGTVYEESFTSEETTISTSGNEFSTRLGGFVATGGTLNGVGALEELSLGITFNRSTENSSSSQTSRTVGYTLADDDVFDNFTVDIREDRVYQVPVFDLKAGQSSCPHEPNTQHREEVSLSVGNAVATNINSTDAAVFNLSLGNLAPSGDVGFYTLALVPESNPDGAAFTINGDALLGDGQVYQIPANGSQTVTLSVERGPEAYVYEDLKVALYSECEFERAVGLGIPRAGVNPLFYKELELDVYFLEPCSEVNISAPMQDWVITPQDQDTLFITLNGYDKNDDDLVLIRLQYRPEVGDGSWINIAEIPKDSLGEVFEVATWSLSNLNDGAYELRAVTQCDDPALNPGFSEVIRGRKETRPPRLLGTPQPSDGVLGPGDEISIRFTKRIDCNDITQAEGIGTNIQNNNVGLYDAATGVLIDAIITCNEDELKIVPNVPNQYIENRLLRVKVEAVEDLFGNALAVPVVWEFQVNRSALYWSEPRIKEAVVEGSGLAVAREIINQGGAAFSYQLQNIPDWLEVFPTTGTVPPGVSETVMFQVDNDLPPGEYQEVLNMVTAQGVEPFDLDIRVVCPPPVWEVNPNTFSYSMSFTLALDIEGAMSQDPLDQIGAFVGGELRGVANVEFVPELSAYMAFLTVYSNQPTGESIAFRVWDARECILYGSTAESFSFIADELVGSPGAPQVLHTNNLLLRKIAFDPGWNWFSYNVEAPEPALNNILAALSRPQGGTIKGQAAFSVFFDAGNVWTGALQALSHVQSYQYKSSVQDSLLILGHPVNPDSVLIPLQPGWNWIGYLPQQGLSIDSALTALEPAAGDILKSQDAFAQFVPGIGWIGSLGFMQPTRGYQLYLQNGGTLAYPALSGGEAPQLSGGTSVEERSTPLFWKADPRAFERSMNIIALVEASDKGGNILEAYDEVGAFSGGALRGSCRPVYVPHLDAYLAFLTVYGAEDAGDIRFRYYEAESGAVIPLEESVPFVSNAVLGTVAEPQPLTLGSNTVEGQEHDRLRVYPNPASESISLHFYAPLPGPATIGLYDALGRKAAEQSLSAIAGENQLDWQLPGTLPSGLYFLRLQLGNQYFTSRLEIQK